MIPSEWMFQCMLFRASLGPQTALQCSFGAFAYSSGDFGHHNQSVKRRARAMLRTDSHKDCGPRAWDGLQWMCNHHPGGAQRIQTPAAEVFVQVEELNAPAKGVMKAPAPAQAYDPMESILKAARAQTVGKGEASEAALELERKEKLKAVDKARRELEEAELELVQAEDNLEEEDEFEEDIECHKLEVEAQGLLDSVRTRVPGSMAKDELESIIGKALRLEEKLLVFATTVTTAELGSLASRLKTVVEDKTGLELHPLAEGKVPQSWEEAKELAGKIDGEGQTPDPSSTPEDK